MKYFNLYFTSKLYGTCKVLKEHYPLRPIVSMLNTPSYKLAKYLDIIIKPHIPKQYYVENNKVFLEKLCKYKCKDNNYCISFEVVSLFTNVPLNETLQMITNGVPDSTIPKSNMINLLKSVLEACFSIRNYSYK